jgi:hypothetical protein
MVVLREILMSSNRASDPLSSWSAAARLLRSFYPLITPAGQSGLARSLVNSADRLPAGTRCADPCLPFIRCVQISNWSHHPKLGNRTHHCYLIVMFIWLSLTLRAWMYI